MVECKCDVAVDTINKILTVCVAILVVADSIISIITLGSFKISTFVMAIYYLYLKHTAGSLHSFSSVLSSS